MNLGKIWYKSRTILVNVAGAVLLVAPELVDLPGLESAQGTIAVALAVANVILRTLTVEPVKLSGK